LKITTLPNQGELPMTLRNISLNLEIGQTILVGQNNEPAQITKIEFHERSGEVNINTTKGPRKALTFKLTSDDNQDFDNPADKYR
jgi:hypothetical protein